MMKNKKCIWGILLVISFFGNATVFALDTEENEFVKNAMPLREVWEKIRPKPRPNVQPSKTQGEEALEQLNRIESSVPFVELKEYLKLQALYLSQENRIDYCDFPFDKITPVMAMEYVSRCYGAFPVFKNDYQSVRKLFSPYLVELFPISWRQYDNEYGEARALVRPPAPRVPRFRYNEKAFLIIGDNFEKAGLFDLAWHAYAEYIYIIFSIPSWNEYSYESSLSPVGCEIWLKAALAAKQAKKDTLAWGFLAKAAVFGNEKVFAEAVKVADEWSQEKPKDKLEKTPEIDIATKREALTQIIDLYIGMNAHPRAWELVNKYPEVFENPAALREEIQEKWLEIVKLVKDRSRGITKLYLYDHEVFPKGDPLKVRIPEALSEEAIKKVKTSLIKDLDAYMQKQKESTSDNNG